MFRMAPGPRTREEEEFRRQEELQRQKEEEWMRRHRPASVPGQPPAPDSVPIDRFPVDRIKANQGMMSGAPVSQRGTTGAIEEAEAQFKKLFSEADPEQYEETLEGRLQNKNIERKLSQQQAISDRNTESLQSRRGYQPSEEVSQQRIARSLRNKLTGQVDELSNLGGGRGNALIALAASQPRQDLSTPEGRRAAFGDAPTTDPSKAGPVIGDGSGKTQLTQDQLRGVAPGAKLVRTGEVNGGNRPEETNQLARLMNRRQQVREYREGRQKAAQEFREKKKLQDAADAEKARQQWAWEEDAKQGGKLGVIAGQMNQMQQDKQNIFLKEQNEREMKLREKIANNDVNARLEAARITAGARGDDPNERVREALSAEYGAKEKIANDMTQPEAVRNAARNRVAQIGDQLTSMNTAGSPQSVVPTGEAGIKFRKMQALKDGLAAAETPRAAATLIREAVSEGAINEAEASMMAQEFGPKADNFNEGAIKYDGWLGPYQWAWDTVTGG